MGIHLSLHARFPLEPTSSLPPTHNPHSVSLSDTTNILSPSDTQPTSSLSPTLNPHPLSLRPLPPGRCPRPLPPVPCTRPSPSTVTLPLDRTSPLPALPLDRASPRTGPLTSPLPGPSPSTVLALSRVASDSHYQSTLDAIYVYVVTSEFPIVPSCPHYPHGAGVDQQSARVKGTHRHLQSRPLCTLHPAPPRGAGMDQHARCWSYTLHPAPYTPTGSGRGPAKRTCEGHPQPPPRQSRSGSRSPDSPTRECVSV